MARAAASTIRSCVSCLWLFGVRAMVLREIMMFIIFYGAGEVKLAPVTRRQKDFDDVRTMRPMPSRVFALLVAMVLLLSGWTTPAAAAAFAPVGLEQASELAQRCADGPAGDVVADGQQAPEQANPETSGDL